MRIKAFNSYDACKQCKLYVRDAKDPDDGVGGWEVWCCAIDERPKFVGRNHRTQVNTYDCNHAQLGGDERD